MTVAELEIKLAAMEADLILLRHEILRLKGVTVIPGFGPVGTFKDDPSFADAVKFGKAYRDKVNRASLKEFDREQEEAKKKPKPKRRKSNARA
ncbi:MAG: hypothetical protein C0467_11335 [Planctomycetaceae bacterium]|nr:hypothetical protein [Planctomycetaceae bacterium]